MNEKIYKTMSLAGAAGITVGIIVMVTGVATGIISIVSGAKLLKNKKGLTFENLRRSENKTFGWTERKLYF